jgi:hypothetical protein
MTQPCASPPVLNACGTRSACWRVLLLQVLNTRGARSACWRVLLLQVVRALGLGAGMNAHGATVCVADATGTFRTSRPVGAWGSFTQVLVARLRLSPAMDIVCTFCVCACECALVLVIPWASPCRWGQMPYDVHFAVPADVNVVDVSVLYPGPSTSTFVDKVTIP